ncbi:MAG: chemotaxis-specific protein-glutamate methyltransferase CheB [Limnothrix sp. CACIAM 69d]|nr:MAG: chemotaxis-specific protein-glutamate methyltransferase CheB [Limnothrix sp. CACIAM 69d]
MAPPPIRVLLVEDSEIAIRLLRRAIESTGALQVVGTARTGLEGLELLKATAPDVICTDLHMPRMNGLEFTREVMGRSPRPILVISNSVREDDRRTVFELLEAGAVDVFPKPVMSSPEQYAQVAAQLIAKIRVLAGVKVFKLRRSSSPSPSPTIALPSALVQGPAIERAIGAIGASTGGPQALREILSQLPSRFPLPLVCVQHISTGFLRGLLDWLSLNCALSIQIAQAGQTPQPGVIYFPPEGHQLEFDLQGRFVTFRTEPVDGHCPSVTATFRSMARVFGKRAIGILLTGMGNDGAKGLLELSQAGGWTIAQDEASSVVFGMPRAAIELGAAKQVLPLSSIALHLVERSGSLARSG